MLAKWKLEVLNADMSSKTSQECLIPRVTCKQDSQARADHPYSQLQQVFKHVGVGAVVGAISQNLAELQDRQGSYLSIYDQPTLPLQVYKSEIRDMEINMAISTTFACNAHGLYCVPLYDTLGAEAVEFIICHSEVKIAFVEKKKISQAFHQHSILCEPFRNTFGELKRWFGRIGISAGYCESIHIRESWQFRRHHQPSAVINRSSWRPMRNRRR